MMPSVMAMSMPMMPVVFRRPIILPPRRRSIVLRLPVPAALMMVLLTPVMAAAKQPAQQSASRATMMTPVGTMAVLILQLGFDSVGRHRTGHAAQYLAQLAVAHLAAQKSTPRTAHRRGEETAVLLLAVRADGAAGLSVALLVSIFAVCVGWLCRAVVGVRGCRSRWEGG